MPRSLLLPLLAGSLLPFLLPLLPEALDVSVWRAGSSTFGPCAAWGLLAAGLVVGAGLVRGHRWAPLASVSFYSLLASLLCASVLWGLRTGGGVTIAQLLFGALWLALALATAVRGTASAPADLSPRAPGRP